jgi:regulator of replication initiation timing
MFKEIICAVTVLVALNYATHHIQRLIEQNVELEEQVLMLTVKISELRDLNKYLKEQNQAFRYEAAAVQRTLEMLTNEDPRRYFTREEWEVGSEAWQVLRDDEKDRILNMTYG